MGSLTKVSHQGDPGQGPSLCRAAHLVWGPISHPAVLLEAAGICPPGLSLPRALPCAREGQVPKGSLGGKRVVSLGPGG